MAKLSKLEKPEIKLNILRGIVVKLPTEENAIELIRIFESGGRKWTGGKLPTYYEDFWKKYGETTCVEAGTFFSEGEGFGFGPEETYKNFGKKIISIEDYYKAQPGITPEIIAKNNTYYDSLPKKK